MKRDICTININGEEGRQTISYDTDDKMLYTSACEEPVDEYTYDSFEEAVEACDMMWGSSDIEGVWELDWIEEE